MFKNIRKEKEGEREAQYRSNVINTAALPEGIKVLRSVATASLAACKVGSVDGTIKK